MLTDGRRWWVWQWQVNHDGSLAGGSLTDERAFVAGQDAEALAWLQRKTEPCFIRRIGRLYQPAGVTTAPCPDDPTGLTEQALNLFLLVVSSSGTRKTRTKFAFTLSGRSTDNLATPAARTTPRCPSSTVNQSSTINRSSPALPQRSRLPMTTARPAATSPPPAATAPPPAGSTLVGAGPLLNQRAAPYGPARPTDAI